MGASVAFSGALERPTKSSIWPPAGSAESDGGPACAERAEAEDRGDDRQPEVDDPVGDDAADRSRKRRARPQQRERKQSLDGARARQRQRAPRQRVPSRVADEQRCDRREVPLVGPQAERQARDVSKPVDRGAERARGVLELEEELAQEVDRVEPLRDSLAPAATAAEAVPEPQGRERESSADGHGDRPGHRQPRGGRAHVAKEQQDRDDARRRSEQRVLERTEAEHAYARVALVGALLAEGMQVDGEPTAPDE